MKVNVGRAQTGAARQLGRSMALPDYDVILAGGGLANGLIAARLAASRPDLRVLVVEQGRTLGGNHTWSFHDSDLTPAQDAWLTPFIAHRWASQEVRFPGHARVLETGYASVTSERFHDVLSGQLGPERLKLGRPIADVEPRAVVLADATRLTARCVIDGRGLRAEPALALGYQKFVGREVETVEPHGLTRPVIMDATVAQTDGYRFVYTLPLDARRLLIEDTYYADRGELDVAPLKGGIDAYAARQGWRIARDVRAETGVLPIVLAGDPDLLFARDDGQPRAGLRAGLFHPTTGYSLPDAVRLADRVAILDDLDAAAVHAAIGAHARELWSARGFFRMLNRMLFIAAAPGERVGVLERFYTLPEPLIRRFYAAAPTLADQVRILAGKPPVPVAAALRALPADAAWRFVRPGARAS